KRYVTIVAAQKGLPSLYEFFQMLGTFFLVVFAWIFFRAISVSHVFEYISTMVSSSFFTLPVIAKPSASSISMLTLSVLMCVFICVEWCGRTYRYGFAPIAVAWRRPFRFALYFIVMCAIFWFGGA